MTSKRAALALWLVAVGPIRASENEAAHDASFHFAYEITPILARAGCSSAECHGAATGKGGFKLSLFGDDPRSDFETITQGLDGRRVDFIAPENSLFLRKPSRDGLKHGGARIFGKKDPDYQALLEWIRDGAPFKSGPSMDLSHIRLEIEDNQARVVAQFDSDSGPVQKDVTHLATLDTSDANVASIGRQGSIHRHGPGEAWIFASYARQHTRRALRQPYGETAEPRLTQSMHPLDRVWRESLAKLGLRPAGPTDRYTLARRLYMDLAGRPPTPFELERFERLEPSTRVEATVEDLLESEEFSESFAKRLAEFFELDPAASDAPNMRGRVSQAVATIAEGIRNGRTLSQISEELLLSPEGQGSWRRFADPRDRAEYISRTMLGMKLGCARCHNHPLDRWTQSDHLQFSAFFTDDRPGPQGAPVPGKFFLPETGEVVEPALLPIGDPLALEPDAPLKTVSRFFNGPAQQQVARNFANRIFGSLLGRPLVDMPDDHRLTNPARMSAVLDLLTQTLLKDDTDPRRFVRFLVTSDLYAATSQPPGGQARFNDPELKYFARRESRTLSPKEFERAVEFVLGAQVDNLDIPESPLARRLHLLNNPAIPNALETPGNLVDAIFDFQLDPENQLNSLFRLILSRPPNPSEQDAFLKLLETNPNAARESGRDLAFALIASREFGALR